MNQNNLQQLWTASDGIKLKGAREAAGIDRFLLARNNTLSNVQLLELEEGWNSYFYSPSIKYNAGKKLLNAFNLKTEYDRLSEEAPSQSRIESIEVETILEASSQAIQLEQNVGHSTAKPLFLLTAIVAICSAYWFVTYSNNSSGSSQTLISKQVGNTEKSALVESLSVATKTDAASNVENNVPTATT
jgi:hypothetical protein